MTKSQADRHVSETIDEVGARAIDARHRMHCEATADERHAHARRDAGTSDLRTASVAHYIRSGPV
jgi:hypothetical protein